MPSKDLIDLKFSKKLEKETSMSENEEEKLKEEISEEEQTEEKTSRWVLLFDVSQFRFCFLPALVLSIAIPLIAGFVFSILRINDDPILFQFSVIIMVFLFSTFSLLRRSKLAVLFNFPIAAIVYLIVFIAHLLTNGWFLYPFGIFGSISRGPLSMILNNLINLGWIDETINLSAIILIPPILDLVFVAFISITIGFFATVLVTGFKNSEGSINLFIIPLKLLSAVFLILLVISIPLTYAGLSKFAEGSAFLGASVTEFAFLQRHSGDSGGLGAQYYSPFDLLNPEFKRLFLEAVARAYDDLMKSYTSFRHVQENFLLNFLLDYVVPQQIQMDNYTAINTQNITRLLDLTLILADIMQAAPGLVHGFIDSYYGLRTGATIIVNAFESQILYIMKAFLT